MTYHSSSSSSVDHRCPKGFVIPDNPSDPRVIWIPNGNGCARACHLPGYFSWLNDAIMSFIVSIVPWIGLILISTVILSWLFDRQRFIQQYLAFLFISLSALFTLSILITGSYKTTTLGRNGINTFCHDNATEIDQSDGINTCIAEAGIVTYCMLSITFCWTMQSIQLFLNVVWNRGPRQSMRLDKRRMALNLFIILVLPMGATIYGGMKGVYGYGRILPICLVSYSQSNSNIDYEYLYLPLFFASVVGTVCLVCVVGKILHRIASTSLAVAPLANSAGLSINNMQVNSTSNIRDLASFLRIGNRRTSTGSRIGVGIGLGSRVGQSVRASAVTPGWFVCMYVCMYVL